MPGFDEKSLLQFLHDMHSMSSYANNPKDNFTCKTWCMHTYGLILWIKGFKLFIKLVFNEIHHESLGLVLITVNEVCRSTFYALWSSCFCVMIVLLLILFYVELTFSCLCTYSQEFSSYLIPGLPYPGWLNFSIVYPYVVIFMYPFKYFIDNSEYLLKSNNNWKDKF